jgi:hypothetical protein
MSPFPPIISVINGPPKQLRLLVTRTMDQFVARFC